jgi:hypothetical protein
MQHRRTTKLSKIRAKGEHAAAAAAAAEGVKSIKKRESG